MLFLSIGNEQISSVTDKKYLELQVDHYLNWEQHVLVITIQNFERYKQASIRKAIYPFENYSEDVHKSS